MTFIILIKAATTNNSSSNISSTTNGVANSPRKKIYFPNHQGFIETLVLYERFVPTATILKDVLLSWPIIGWALRLLSSIPIDRGKGSETVKKIFSMGKELLDSGFSLIYYPEGTRRKPGDLGIYKKTGAELALQTDSEIIPIVHNAGESWYGGDFVITPGDVIFFIGDHNRSFLGLAYN